MNALAFFNVIVGNCYGNNHSLSQRLGDEESSDGIFDGYVVPTDGNTIGEHTSIVPL